MKNTAVQQDIG